MKWTIEFIEIGKYFKVINEGIYEVGESARLYQEILTNELWKPGSAILFDNRLVDYRNVNYEVMSQASVNLAKNEEKIGNSKIGYIVESPLGYGISRQFQILMDGKVPVKIEVFKDEKQAVDWLIEKTNEEAAGH